MTPLDLSPLEIDALVEQTLNTMASGFGSCNLTMTFDTLT